MSGVADYLASERLRDGRAVEIRALQPDDKDDMLAAISRTGMESMQRRFFAVKRGFYEKEIAFFMNIDFTNHVALVALAEEEGRKVIIGGGRYIVVEPGQAEKMKLGGGRIFVMTAGMMSENTAAHDLAARMIGTG